MKTPSPAKTRKPKAARPAAAPDPAPAADEPLTFDDDGIKRVQDIIRNARATWFALLGALVFASVTLASVKDISFFVNSVETKLPIVGISVPVVSFFWAGSLLIAALYAYFHLYLELLWQALGDFPARDKSGAPLADRIEPWIVADTALRFRDWLRGDTGEASASRKRAMPWISGFVSIGLVWVFGLAVIFWFWWRSMPAHEPLLTLFLGAVLWVTVFVFGSSLAGAWTHLKFENHEAQRPVYWQWSVPLVFVMIMGATLVRTGKEPVYEYYEAKDNLLLFGENVCGWQRPNEQKPPASPDSKAASEPTETPVKEPAPRFPCWRRSDLFAHMLFPAPANLREAVFTEKPKDWQGKEIAETEFRIRWCKERGEPKCDNPLELGNRVFVDKTEEEDFQAAWKERWAALLAQMSKPDLREADLRGANLSSARLEGVDLTRARLEGAILRAANLDGANLAGARMNNSKLLQAIMDGANLENVSLKGAELDSASLVVANLSSANLIGANLSMAKLNGAMLSGARFNGADLSYALISGSPEEPLQFYVENFHGATLDGTAFRFVEDEFGMLANESQLSLTFGDKTVSSSVGFQFPCQWANTQLSDSEFFGRWEGWVFATSLDPAHLILDQYESVEPPPECAER